MTGENLIAFLINNEVNLFSRFLQIYSDKSTKKLVRPIFDKIVLAVMTVRQISGYY